MRLLVRFCVGICLVSTAFLAVPAGIAAQSSEAEARALFEQGLEYAQQERWGEALVYFRRSHVIVERPSTLGKRVSTAPESAPSGTMYGSPAAQCR